jgi:N-acetyl-gamma-glutamylphosphate reductase
MCAKKIAVIGASGYTGADAVRLLARHPHAEISALTATPTPARRWPMCSRISFRSTCRI